MRMLSLHYFKVFLWAWQGVFEEAAGTCILKGRQQKALDKRASNLEILKAAEIARRSSTLCTERKL
jgi:hypothetical protein